MKEILGYTPAPKRKPNKKERRDLLKFKEEKLTTLEE